ncbi:30S ribosomal protein S18 [Candidatus Marinamargulisbacteria bacterium SCGC AG-439-L15]|nr:30S ribosomal protein S18 [Candidatus Marinamargulisbacteria bacterium SCGC AG-439-L15]
MSNQHGNKTFQSKPKVNRRRRKRPCFFTANNYEVIDYKDINLLKRFVTDRGKIAPRRTTGLTAKWQRKLAQAIKRARYACLLPHCIS